MTHQEGGGGLHFPYLTAKTSLTPLASVLRKSLQERDLWPKDFRHHSQAVVFKLVLPGISFVAWGKSYNLSEPPVSSCVERIKWHLPDGRCPWFCHKMRPSVQSARHRAPSATWLFRFRGDVNPCPLRAGQKSIHLTENYSWRWSTGLFSDLTRHVRAWHVSQPVHSNLKIPVQGLPTRPRRSVVSPN